MRGTGCGLPRDPDTRSHQRRFRRRRRYRSDAGDAKRGEALAKAEYCTSCHTPNYAGTGTYANITQDEATGIGAWSDEEIAQAIVDGVDDEGDSLCLQMPRSTLSDAEIADLGGLPPHRPAVSNEITSACPGHGG